MKRLSFVPLVLAVSLLTTIAFAAAEKKAGTFQELAASGVSGKVDLLSSQAGQTTIHGQARNLLAGTEYSVIWLRNNNCAPESNTQLIETFTAKQGGIAAFQGKVMVPVSEINSVSIVRTSDQVVQACAPVTAQ